MKPPCVEFYRGTHWTDLYKRYQNTFSWRLRAKNGQIILSPHETFISRRNAVESFKRVCAALDARGPWEIRDGFGGAMETLIK